MFIDDILNGWNSSVKHHPAFPDRDEGLISNDDINDITKESLDFFKRNLLSALCFEVSNVADYIEKQIWENSKKKDFVKPFFDKTEIPCVKLPAKTVWFEWRVSFRKDWGQRGLLLWEEPYTLPRTLQEKQLTEVRCLLFTKLKDQNNIFGHFEAIKKFCFNLEGEIQTDSDGSYLHDHHWEKFPDIYASKDSPINVALFALSLLHCKNVKTIEKTASAKLQKARAKRGKLPLIKYHLLSVSPIKTTYQKEGVSPKKGSQHQASLHICRGHFKDYRNGKGLFGKHKGLFWWDVYARGNAEEGIVLKDYKLNSPESKDE